LSTFTSVKQLGTIGPSTGMTSNRILADVTFFGWNPVPDIGLMH